MPLQPVHREDSGSIKNYRPRLFSKYRMNEKEEKKEAQEIMKSSSQSAEIFGSGESYRIEPHQKKKEPHHTSKLT